MIEYFSEGLKHCFRPQNLDEFVSYPECSFFVPKTLKCCRGREWEIFL